MTTGDSDRSASTVRVGETRMNNMCQTTPLYIVQLVGCRRRRRSRRYRAPCAEHDDAS